LSKDVYIGRYVSLRDECKIQNLIQIFDGVKIKNQVFVGPNAPFTNGKVPRAFKLDLTIIKTLMNHATITGLNSTNICGVIIG